MFVGRGAELEILESSLLQTINEQPEHFLLTGERGIGKTSLLMYLRAIAEGQLELICGDTVNFLVLDTVIDSQTEQVNLVRKLELALTRSLGKTEKARSFLADVWDFLQRVRVMDSGITAGQRSAMDELLVEQFAYTFADVVNRVTSEDGGSIFSARYDGVLILLDEADNSPEHLQLGAFLKVFLERLQRERCNRVLIGLAGLSQLRDILRRSHPSSLRVFRELELSRLAPEEVGRVLDLCIQRANEKNEVKTNLHPEAKQQLISLAEGYPHFIQQFGHSAFAADRDNEISSTDVYTGAFGSNGALEQIGNRYYRDDFYSKIQKDSYRQVLRIMAAQLDGWVTRQQIKIEFKGTEATLNNALRALRERHIIIPKEGERGVYRLQHKGFAMWIRLYADPDYWKKTLVDESAP